MHSKHWIDDFKGSEDEYIKYLERLVLDSRCQIQQSILRPPNPSFNSLAESQVPANLSAPLPENTSRKTLDQNFNEKSLTSDSTVRNKELKFVEYDATQERVRNERPPWHAEMDGVLDSIPDASSWMAQRKKELGVYSSTQNHPILATVLAHSLIAHPAPEPTCSTSSRSPDTGTLLECAYAYGCATRNSQIKADSATKGVLFQELIFVSFCAVLESCGIPVDSIDQAMKSCFFAKTEKSLERIRRGALWVNRCIVKLCQNKWGLRSTEIFLVVGRSTTLYGRFSDYTSESLPHFTRCLEDPRYTEKYQESDNWLPYNIPCIIKNLVGDALTLQQICLALGYPEGSLETFTSILRSYDHFIEAGANTSYSLVPLQNHAPKRQLSDPQPPRKRRRKTTSLTTPPASKRGDSFTAGSTSSNTVFGTNKPSHSIPEGQLTYVSDSNPETRQQETGGEACQGISLPICSGDSQPAVQDRASSDATFDTMELPIELSSNDVPLQGTGFDMLSMMQMGFDVASMMEMGFDTTSVMEPGLRVPSPADIGIHQGETQHIGNGEIIERELPLWTSSSPVFMAAS